MRQTFYQETEAALPPPRDGSLHIMENVLRGLPEFVPTMEPHDGSVIVCGSGPSLSGQLREIAAERNKGAIVIAVKGAHDMLCENGIEPEYFVSIEVEDRREQLRLHNDFTTYLLASRCHPEMFDLLMARKIQVFHAGMRGESQLEVLIGRPIVGGGTTSGLRAITLAWLMGYRKIILFGFDSCLAHDRRKHYDGKPLPESAVVDRWCAGEQFFCNRPMAMQADEFQVCYDLLPGITFDVRGGGLIAAIVAERRRTGLAA